MTTSWIERMMDRQQRVATFEEVVPFSETDQPCFDELRQVLAKYGALNRFGICLLHDHFPIAQDEILIETVNPVERTMVLKPMRTLEVGSALETAWQFSSDPPQPGVMPVPIPKQKCIKGCKIEELPNGEKRHYVTHKWGDSPT